MDRQTGVSEDVTRGRERDGDAVKERRRRRQRLWWLYIVISALLDAAMGVMLLAGVPAFQDHQGRIGSWPLVMVFFSVVLFVTGLKMRRGQLDETAGDLHRDTAERITGSRRQYKIRRGRTIRE